MRGPGAAGSSTGMYRIFNPHYTRPVLSDSRPPSLEAYIPISNRELRVQVCGHLAKRHLAWHPRPMETPAAAVPPGLGSAQEAAITVQWQRVHLTGCMAQLRAVYYKDPQEASEDKSLYNTHLLLHPLSDTMKVLSIGASRNIGYAIALRLLKAGHTVVFLLRSPSAFDGNADIAPFVTSGHARLVKGDALNLEDVRQAWATAESDNTPVDLVIYSVGGTPKFTLKGFVISPPNLCSTGILNLLAVLSQPSAAAQPRLVIISSHGLNKEGHASVPLPLKPIYYAIDVPHRDKLGLERAIHHSAGWVWKDPEPEADILPTGWKEKLPAPGWLKSAVVVRPALLTSGIAKSENGGKYRIGETLAGAWTISREDVAHFVTEDVLQNWSQYENKPWSIGY